MYKHNADCSIYIGHGTQGAYAYVIVYVCIRNVCACVMIMAVCMYYATICVREFILVRMCGYANIYTHYHALICMAVKILQM
jgi:hypothetical protein